MQPSDTRRQRGFLGANSPALAQSTEPPCLPTILLLRQGCIPCGLTGWVPLALTCTRLLLAYWSGAQADGGRAEVNVITPEASWVVSVRRCLQVWERAATGVGAELLGVTSGACQTIELGSGFLLLEPGRKYPLIQPDHGVRRCKIVVPSRKTFRHRAWIGI